MLSARRPGATMNRTVDMRRSLRRSGGRDGRSHGTDHRASSGIGAACTARLARGGWRVYAGVRRDEDRERLLAEHTDADVVPVLIDVTDRSSIDDVIARIDGEVGALHGVVKNAGITVVGPVELLDEMEWREQLNVTSSARSP